MLLNVHERFWQMDNRYWIVFYPDFTKVGSMVIGFMSKEELCCDSAELGMDHPVKELDKEELATILADHGSILLWDFFTNGMMMMTKRGD